jgi:hypothetical protein
MFAWRFVRGGTGLGGKRYRAVGEAIPGLGGSDTGLGGKRYRAWGEAIPGLGGSDTGLGGKSVERFYLQIQRF